MCFLIWKLLSKTFPRRKNGKKKKNKEEEKGELKIMLKGELKIDSMAETNVTISKETFYGQYRFGPHSHTSLVAS